MGGWADGRMGGVVLALLAAVACPLVYLSAQTAHPPNSPSAHPTIDTIIIDNRNVFEQDDPSPDWVAHLANGLHMRTRQWVKIGRAHV